jgi:glutamyl-tRNA synthetase|tara:strand:- start:12 stop:1322 length:1311 start_codon:yes stop_codon:yes gene_type:complete
MKLRIAPSPTGNLHIGNARTALFNWLYARSNDGQFLVRIDDTDTERSLPEYEENIINNLKWLGIDWDEGIEVGGKEGTYRQSDRFERYTQVAEELLEKGLAYEEDGAVRFKVEDKGEIKFHDKVRGSMKFDLSDIEDFVLLRSDKSPTYHLASTVDDIDYGITLIARGEDILSSTPKHILLMNSLDAPLPEFCHLSLLFGPDGKKLSKRHGDTSVSSYKDKGILASALFNYMCLLGWSPGNDLEIFERDLAIEKFDLNDVLPNPAIFDTKKLLWMNGQYIREIVKDDFETLFVESIENSISRELFEDELDRLKKIVQPVQERIETLNDINEQIKFLLDEPFEIDQNDWKNVNSLEGQKYMKKIRERFISTESFELKNIEEIMRFELEELSIKPKIGFQITRVAVTGTKISPPLFESIFALGKETTIARLAESIEDL